MALRTLGVPANESHRLKGIYRAAAIASPIIFDEPRNAALQIAIPPLIRSEPL
jgi:hypothetical protein